MWILAFYDTIFFLLEAILLWRERQASVRHCQIHHRGLQPLPLLNSHSLIPLPLLPTLPNRFHSPLIIHFASTAHSINPDPDPWHVRDDSRIVVAAPRCTPQPDVPCASHGRYAASRRLRSGAFVVVASVGLGFELWGVHAVPFC